MLQDTKSLTVIKCLRQNFARYGIPETLISDNGPEYSSCEFQAFASDFGFKHITSSPRYPQSNGLAERTVQTAKKLLKKAIEDHQDPYLSLLELRNTPLSGVGLSPVQLLMGRRTRSFIPAKSSLYTPNNFPGKSVRKNLQSKQQKQKHYYDRNAKERTPLARGDVIRIRSHQSSSTSWNPGQVVKQCEEPRSYIVKSGNRMFRRNHKDLVKTKEKCVPENSREEEDEVVIIPPVQADSTQTDSRSVIDT
ncbi:uncharacterized protein K02A2.6-like [Saccostrea cucullata]|uniref:uncharacterized protein K02A2.6-like n=1 Tax=Saccostrea cuccullata TaxID=36930 RepID=UPI002ED556C6